MKCLKCGYENIEGSKVCISCGNVLDGGDVNPTPVETPAVETPTVPEQPVVEQPTTSVEPAPVAEQPASAATTTDPVISTETPTVAEQQYVVLPTPEESTPAVEPQAQVVQAEQPVVNNEQVQPATQEKKDNKTKVIIISIVAILVIALAGFGFSQLMGGSGSSGGDTEEKEESNTPKSVAEQFMKAWTNKNVDKMMKLGWYDEDDYTKEDMKMMLEYMADRGDTMKYKFKKEVSKTDSTAREKFELKADDSTYVITLSLKNVNGTWKVNIDRIDIDYE